MDGPKLGSYVKFENKFDDVRNIMKSDAALYELLKPYLLKTFMMYYLIRRAIFGI